MSTQYDRVTTFCTINKRIKDFKQLHVGSTSFMIEFQEGGCIYNTFVSNDDYPCVSEFIWNTDSEDTTPISDRLLNLKGKVIEKIIVYYFENELYIKLKVEDDVLDSFMFKITYKEFIPTIYYQHEEE